MNKHTTLTANDTNWGNAAVDGLIAGTAAGVVMIAYLLAAMATLGESPADLLNRFSAGDMQGTPLTGALAHLAISMIYGMGFALIWHGLNIRARAVWRVIGGIIYAGLLFGISVIVMLPAVQSPLLGIPALHWGIAHLLYGATLGLVIHRSASTHS